jgi:hypothetical protein
MQSKEVSLFTSRTCRSTTPRQRKSPASTSMASAPCSPCGVRRTARSSLGPPPRPACASSSRQPPDPFPSTSTANNPTRGAKSSSATATRSGRKPPRASRELSCTMGCVSEQSSSSSSSQDLHTLVNRLTSHNHRPLPRRRTPSNQTGRPPTLPRTPPAQNRRRPNPAHE